MVAFMELAYDEQLTRLTDAARRVLLDYGLPGAGLELVVYVTNAVFKVTAKGGSYALRLHKPGGKPPDWIRSELIWLSALRQQCGLPVPEPLLTDAPDWLAFASLDGLNEAVNCTLLTWIEGQAYQPDTIPLSAVEQAGELLARLHTCAQAFQPDAGFTRPRLDWEGLFGADSPYNPGEGARIFTDQQQAIFAQVQGRVQAVMQSLGQGQDTFGLIHADFLPKNLLFNEQGAAALDFDDCSWGYFLYDLAPALWQFKYEPRYIDLRVAFLTGYTRLRPLSSTDFSYLETFIAARHVASCRWLASNLHNPRIRERAPVLIAERTADLERFLQTGTMTEHGRKEFF